MIEYLVFVPACFALNLAFGPNNLLALNHGAQRGPVFAVTASLGRIGAFAVMIAISALGLGVLLATSASLFTAVKVLGAAYLIWIGIRLLRSTVAADPTLHLGHEMTLSQGFLREMLIAVGNPKAILIFVAFFPQFINVDHYAESYALLGGLFLILELTAVLVYATAGHLAAGFARTKLHWFQRVSGAGMIVFGLLLLFTRRPAAAG